MKSIFGIFNDTILLILFRAFLSACIYQDQKGPFYRFPFDSMDLNEEKSGGSNSYAMVSCYVMQQNMQLINTPIVCITWDYCTDFNQFDALEV